MCIPHFTLIAPAPRQSKKQLAPATLSSPSLCDAWRAAVLSLRDDDRSKFTIMEGKAQDVSKEDLQSDRLVSPANSFGTMDGGYDLYLSKAFMHEDHDIWALSNVCQVAIRERYRGYAPPGTCTLAELSTSFTSSSRNPDTNPFNARFIAIIPTMRLPEDVSWHKDLVYNCMWSLLVELDRFKRSSPEKPIVRVLMTGLGTGQGFISAERCAKQMMLAVKHFTAGLPDEPRWADVMLPAAEVEETFDAHLE